MSIRAQEVDTLKEVNFWIDEYIKYGTKVGVRLTKQITEKVQDLVDSNKIRKSVVMIRAAVDKIIRAHVEKKRRR